MSSDTSRFALTSSPQAAANRPISALEAELLQAQQSQAAPLARIAVVDDDPDIRDLLRDYLSKQGFAAVALACGAELRAHLRQQPVDLVVLDVMMPGEDGFAIARELRTHSELPIVLLTAKDDPLDRILGLELGSDDYVTKPFVPRELVARIKTILRRSRPAAAAAAAPLDQGALPAGLTGAASATTGEAGRHKDHDAQDWQPPDLPAAPPRRLARFADGKGGTWVFEVAARQLVAPDGAITSLSQAEYQLLRLFVEHPQRIFGRDQLIDLLKGQDAEHFDRAVDLRVSRLRARLRDDPKDARIIRTIRQEGYQFCPTVDWSQREPRP